jgi:hypothetical protein
MPFVKLLSTDERKAAKSGAGFAASCQQPNHARYLYSRRFAEKRDANSKVAELLLADGL